MNETPVHILVVEDEFITANAIKEALISYGHVVVGIARDAIDAIEILDTKKVDIAILDINIQGSKNGLWIAKKIEKDYHIPFIFLTAYGDNDSITKAIATQPSGYLTKPFKKADIYSTISLALIKSESKTLKPVKDEENNPNPEEFFYVKGKNSFLKIIKDDILFIKSDLKYVELQTTTDLFTLRYSLHEISSKLSEDQFIKVHRSYIINKFKIESIGSNYLLTQGHEIPISANRKDEILAQFNFL